MLARLESRDSVEAAPTICKDGSLQLLLAGKVGSAALLVRAWRGQGASCCTPTLPSAGDAPAWRLLSGKDEAEAASASKTSH